MANGKQTSLYLRTEAEEALRRHVERTGRSRSWCASDLIVCGDKMTDMDLVYVDVDGEWKGRNDEGT